MRRPFAIFLALGSALPAQGMGLDRAVDRPLVYVAQRAAESGGDDVLGLLQTNLLAPLGIGGSSAGAETTGVMTSVERLLARLAEFSENSEMALVGLMPLSGPSRPLMVFHAELRDAGVAEMRKLLDAGSLAKPARQVHGQQLFELRGGNENDQSVEVVLKGSDLVVSNDPQTMTRMLDPRTKAGGGFASKPRFQKLRAKISTPPGSLMIYADWRALASRLGRVLADETTWFLELSGIRRPEQLMFVVRPAPAKSGLKKKGLHASLVLHHAGASLRRGRGSRGPQIRSGGKRFGGSRIDGWLDLIEPAPWRDLLPGVAPGGPISMAAMVDLRRMLLTHRGPRMRQLQARIFNSCNHLGIDIGKQIFRRLSETAGAQLLFVDAAEGERKSGAADLRLAWSIKAKSVRDARELFSLFAKTLPRKGDAVLGGSAQHPELHFSDVFGDPEKRLALSRVRDALVVSFDAKVIRRVRQLASPRRGATTRRGIAALTNRVQRLGLRRQATVAGVFSFDLSGIDPRGAKALKASEKFSGLFGMHGGVLLLEEDFARLEVFSELESP